jgi:hypothetical protein
MTSTPPGTGIEMAPTPPLREMVPTAPLEELARTSFVMYTESFLDIPRDRLTAHRRIAVIRPPAGTFGDRPERLTGHPRTDVGISRSNCWRFQPYLVQAEVNLFANRLSRNGFEYDMDANCFRPKFRVSAADCFPPGYIIRNEEWFIRASYYRYSDRFTAGELKSLLQLLDYTAPCAHPSLSDHQSMRHDLEMELLAPTYVLEEHARALLKAMDLANEIFNARENDEVENGEVANICPRCPALDEF